MSQAHTFAVRVYYEDTDFSGYVYHAAYLKFLERGRTEYLRSAGLTQSVLQREEAGLLFVVARMTLDFSRPAAMDDLLAVDTQVLDARGPLVRFKQVVRRDVIDLVRAEVHVVAIRDGRAVRVPPSVRERFAAADRGNNGD